MEISIHRIIVSFSFIALTLHFEEVVMRLAPSLLYNIHFYLAVYIEQAF